MYVVNFFKKFFDSLIRPILILTAFIAGLFLGSHETLLYKLISDLKYKIQQDLELVTQEASTLTKTHPTHFLQPAFHKGNGVTINKLKSNDDYILVSSFYDDNNEIRLIKRDGEIVVRWPIHFSSIFNEKELPGMIYPSTDWNTDIHGALILPDGSIVFNFEYYGLVKLNKCGEVVWKVGRQTHHSVEIAENGGFWVPGRINLPLGSESPYPPFQTPIIDDTIMKVSPSGEILNEISVTSLFYHNNLDALLTATGTSFTDDSALAYEIVHLNKIAELSIELANDFPIFKAGDLVISLRRYNLVMVIDPEKLKIKWWKIGPWLRQHDPEFNKGGKISVFNNNLYRNALSSNDKTNADIPRISNIMEIDPVTNEHEIVYGGTTNQVMLSVIRGKHEVLHNGGLLITEFEGGRVFETNKAGEIIWQYINRYDEDEVAEITEARLYPKDYFTVKDWSCTTN